MSALKPPQFRSLPPPDASVPASPPLRLLQLTDLHLFAEPEGQLLGVATRSSFESVLAFALKSRPPAQALVLTGDLVHDESFAGYASLRQTLDAVGLPYYCLAGNHDRPEPMSAALGDTAIEPPECRRLQRWNLIFLDSLKPGCNGGRLAAEQLDGLRALLAVNGETPTLILLHHHPLPIGSLWMDTMRIENGDELLRICACRPQVKAVVFGHIHQEFADFQGACQILGAPSTGIQFLPGSARFALDRRPPGYREFLLYPDGRLVTRVVRLDRYCAHPMPQADGY